MPAFNLPTEAVMSDLYYTIEDGTEWTVGVRASAVDAFVDAFTDALSARGEVLDVGERGRGGTAE